MKELLEVLDRMQASVSFEHYTNLFSRFTEIWIN